MEVRLGLLCDAANVSAEGKLNVLGMFDTVPVPSFPHVHPVMALVFLLSASPAEIGDKRDITIRVVDQDGGNVGELNGDFVVPEAHASGMSSEMGHILRLESVEFESAGDYAFHILIDRDDKYRIPLSVVESVPAEEKSDDQ